MRKIDHTIRNKKAPSNRFVASAAVIMGLATVVIWSYWPSLIVLSRIWKTADYSSGQLVLFVALFLVWHERRTLAQCPLSPVWSTGLALLFLGFGFRLYGFLFARPSIENYSIVFVIAGLVLFVAGWRVFRCVVWILLFLFLMFPFPGSVHNLISGPLQTMATVGSVFVMEAFFNVSRQGNTMVLNDTLHLGVEEACSGLRMLTAFIMVAAFIAYMVKRHRWQKTVLLFSSIPVALVCNIVRIVVTAVLMLYASAELAQKFFHDFAGLIMMPAAVMLLFGELWLMDKLVMTDVEPRREKRIKKGRIGGTVRR
jgi:exosortase